jgi:hypothetical protein
MTRSKRGWGESKNGLSFPDVARVGLFSIPVAAKAKRVAAFSKMIPLFLRVRRDMLFSGGANMKIGNWWKVSAATVLLAAVQGVTARGALVFSDDFSSSTLNGASNPTATSTSYDIASAKATTSSIGVGDLKIAQPSTTSAISEAQARFATSPVVLSSAGDSVDFRITFTDTAGLTPGNGSPLYFGLFNSGSSAPKTDLQTSGLSSSLTADAGGGVAGWTGYVAQIASGTGTSKLITRPAQTGPDNTNQDLLSNGASGSQSFHSPTGTTITSGSTGTPPPNATLTAGNVYTEDFTATLNAAGGMTLVSSLYSGPAAIGTPIATQTGTEATATTTSFDGLAFGFRISTSPAAAATIDANALSVTSSLAAPVPEPASLGVLGAGALLMLRRRRR